jgi:hypothetical protein
MMQIDESSILLAKFFATILLASIFCRTDLFHRIKTFGVVGVAIRYTMYPWGIARDSSNDTLYIRPPSAAADVDDRPH